MAKGSSAVGMLPKWLCSTTMTTNGTASTIPSRELFAVRAMARGTSNSNIITFPRTG
ncbi:hypothetical protein [Cohnella sp.]|uniref:hypothetical protein n=1 Tax=Cohnella sp. TaxID=1883426 RepID=UPI00356812DE